jgi:hypothetical protein
MTTNQRTTKQVRLRRGTTSEHTTFIGAVGEVTVDTDLKTLRVHDGVTAGGTLIMKGDADSYTIPWTRVTNKPTLPVVPTNISAFTNDAGYLSSADLSNFATDTELSNATAGIVQLLTNSLALKANVSQLPVVPENVSAFTNDADYATVNYVSAAVGGAIQYVNEMDRSSLTNGQLSATLGTSGTLTMPLLLPVTFTATCDPAHAVAPLTLTSDAWHFEVQFQVNPDGTVQTMIGNNTPWTDNPGYTDSMEFVFTETDHGIPDYMFTLRLVDIQHPGPMMYTTNLAASVPPEYPSTVKSLGAIKLTSNGQNLVFGTDGELRLPGALHVTTGLDGAIIGTNGVVVKAKNANPLSLEWSLNDEENIYADNPALNAVTASLAFGLNGVNIEVNNPDNGGSWTFGPDGVTHLPGNIKAVNNNSIGITVSEELEQLENSYLAEEMLFQVTETEWESSIAPAVSPWAGLNSYDAYPMIMQYMPWSGGGLPPPSNIVPIAKTAKDAYELWQGALASAGNVSVNVGAKHWTFGKGGVLSLGSNFGAIRADQMSGRVTIADMLGETGIPMMPSTAVHIGGADAFVITRGNGSNNPTWSFKDNGKLTLPINGDIVDSNGVSVLGASTSTGNFTFTNDTVSNTAGMLLSTARGTLALGTDMEVPGVPQHFHIAFDGSNTNAPTQELFLGDDFNAVQIHGVDGAPYYGVRVRANDRQGGAQKEWQFNADGNLSFPDATVQSTAWTGSVSYDNVTDKPQLSGIFPLQPGNNQPLMFTLPAGGTYTLWLRATVDNGVIAYNATFTITNANLPVVGQQFAYVYTGGGTKLDIISLPSQIVGTPGTILRDPNILGTSSTDFQFVLSNSSGQVVDLHWGWFKV